MAPAESESTAILPNSVEEVEKIRLQTNRILEAERFKNSRRYPALLRYIIEETLEGRGDALKERTIGVCVFGCPTDYDTADNPVVRVTIAEVRKRLTQYYQEEGHDAEIRIDLPSGHYTPKFYHSANHDAVENDRTDAPAIEAVAPEAARLKPVLALGLRLFLHSRLAQGIVLAGFGILLALGGYTAWKASHPSALEAFWRPLLDDRRTIIFCLPMGNNSGGSTAAAAGIIEQEKEADPENPYALGQQLPYSPLNSTFQAFETLDESIVFSDALAAHRISHLLSLLKRDSDLRLAPTITLNDLRTGPVVLIGGIDNPWTLHALIPLPYRFAGTAEERYWILDRKNPEKKDWGMNTKLQLSAIKRDYAIIARIHDQSTGQLEVIVAGVGMTGTALAGQFVVDPEQMEALRQRIGPAFRDHDFEVILSTEVVNGSAGSPHIEAISVW
jgi:hypothetical protein